MFTEPRGFGQRLRTARLHAGLSQSALESRSGIPKARLSRYENGHVLPSIDTLGRLASAIGVSEASLLGDQRAVVEEFFSVLFQRGVQIYSVEQAGRLANAVADLLTAAAPPIDGMEQGGDVASATMEEVAGAEVKPMDAAPAEMPRAGSRSRHASAAQV
jgi:transcriptional regulator with XRE-family HTH domain